MHVTDSLDQTARACHSMSTHRRDKSASATVHQVYKSRLHLKRVYDIASKDRLTDGIRLRQKTRGTALTRTLTCDEDKKMEASTCFTHARCSSLGLEVQHVVLRKVLDLIECNLPPVSLHVRAHLYRTRISGHGHAL